MPMPEGTLETILPQPHVALFVLIDEETEAQGGKVTCLKPHSK